MGHGMLRITTESNNERTVLKVEGRLVPPWVDELESCWRRIEKTKANALVVDLRSVTFAGIEAKQLLARIHGSGAQLLTSGILMNALVEQLNREEKIGKGA